MSSLCEDLSRESGMHTKGKELVRKKCLGRK